MVYMKKRPALAVIVLLASLGLAITVSAQTTAKTPKATPAQTKEKGTTAKTSEAAEKAAETYKTVCQVCHLVDGKGLVPDMSFNDGVWKHGTTTEAMAKVISDGVPGTVMLPFKDKLSKQEIVELTKIVRSFDPKLKK